MKRIVRRVVCMITMALIIASNAQVVQGSVSVKKKQTYINVYKKVLSKKSLANEEEEYGKTEFALCDVNGDGTPELFISPGNGTLGHKYYYTFKKQKLVKLKAPNYPMQGTLYLMPSRKTYGFYRGGPAGEYMPHTIAEYKIKGKKIKCINNGDWEEHPSKKDKYFLNGKKCKAKAFKKIYKAMTQEIEFVPNSSWNRSQYLK